MTADLEDRDVLSVTLMTYSKHPEPMNTFSPLYTVVYQDLSWIFTCTLRPCLYVPITLESEDGKCGCYKRRVILAIPVLMLASVRFLSTATFLRSFFSS